MEVAMQYSEKFRKEVMEYIDRSCSQDYVAKLFNISSKTVWNWVKQRKELGHLKPKQTTERRHRKLPKEELIQYVKDHPDAYIREIAAHFKCGKTSVQNRLKKLGISRKKNSSVQRARRK